MRFHRSGTKRIRHPDVGDLEFAYEGLELPDSPGLVLFAYTTVAGSSTEERLHLLGSRAPTDRERPPFVAVQDLLAPVAGGLQTR